MASTIRLFQLIETLRAARNGMTARALAERLEVYKRTIYRDVATLQSMGVPIDGAAGVGYVLRPGFDLAPLRFSAPEAEAIRLGLSLLVRSGDPELIEAAETVADKLRRAGGDPGAAIIAKGEPMVPDGVDPALLRRAIRDVRGVSIRYRTEEGVQSERQIVPLALTYYPESLVLSAWCDLRQGIRSFRLDRIDELTLAKQSYVADLGRFRKALAADIASNAGDHSPKI